MKSTGEVMAIDPDRFGAYYKSQVACSSPLPKRGNVFLSVRDEDKPQVAELAAKLKELGFGIYATLGTSTYLWGRGIESRAAFRISRGRPNAIDLIRKGEIQWVVNTSGRQRAVALGLCCRGRSRDDYACRFRRGCRWA